MKRRVLSILTVAMFAINVVHAEKLARVMKGQVVADNPASLRVMITDVEGVILDVASPNAAGAYKLDLTVMDLSSQEQVKKLNLVVRDQKGKSKKVSVAQYMNSFDDTVVMRAVIFD